MALQKTLLSRRKLFLLLTFGFIAFIAYFLLFIDMPSFVETISQTNLAIYGASFVVYFIGVFFSSMVWHSLLNVLTVKTTIKNAHLFTWVGLFFDATIPKIGLSGDVAKTYLFSKTYGEDVGKIGASVIGQKIILITLTVVTFSIGLVIVLFNRTLEPLATFSIVLFLLLSLVSLILIYYLSVKPKATYTLLQFAIRIGLFFRKSWNSLAFNKKAVELLDNFHISISVLKTKPRALGRASMYSILSWFFDIAVMFLVFVALGHSIPFDSVLIVYTISGVLHAVGIGIFGINEIVMISTFRALGLPDGLSVSVTLLSRAVTLWFRLIVSYGAFQWASIKIARQAPSLSHSPPNPLT
jgi:uncharacterized protein (TIRG00374 family)